MDRDSQQNIDWTNVDAVGLGEMQEITERLPGYEPIFVFPNLKSDLKMEIAQIERLIDWLIEEQLDQVSTNFNPNYGRGIRLEVGEETSSLTH